MALIQSNEDYEPFTGYMTRKHSLAKILENSYVGYVSVNAVLIFCRQ